MKFHWKTIQDRSAPVILGLGLWLVGNSLIGTTSVRAQEVTQNTYAGCVDHTDDSGVVSNCQASLKPGSNPPECVATGDTVRTVEVYSFCDPTVSGNVPCPAPNASPYHTKKVYQAYCASKYEPGIHGCVIIANDPVYKRTDQISGGNCHAGTAAS